MRDPLCRPHDIVYMTVSTLYRGYAPFNSTAASAWSRAWLFALTRELLSAMKTSRYRVAFTGVMNLQVTR